MNTNREPSESRQTAKASQDQRELLRVTLSSIGDAVITTDKELSVTFLNPVAETLTGWTQEEATGVPLEMVFKTIVVTREKPKKPVLVLVPGEHIVDLKLLAGFLGEKKVFGSGTPCRI